MTPANQNNPNLIGFPFIAGKREALDDEFGGPLDYLEAVNGNPGWKLYLVSGRTGEYREIATLVDRKASEVLFSYISSIHRTYEEAGTSRMKDDVADIQF